MSNPLHKINVCNRSASLTFKTRQVEDISLQNILNSAESKFGLINLCFQLSSTFHIELMPAPHRRGEGHSHVKNCTGRPVASVKLLACKFSIPSLPPSLLPQVLTLTTSHQTTWPDPSCEKIWAKYCSKLWTVNYMDSCNAVTWTSNWFFSLGLKLSNESLVLLQNSWQYELVVEWKTHDVWRQYSTYQPVVI